MAEHRRATDGKNGDIIGKHRKKRNGQEPSPDQSPARESALSSLSETPFYPRMEDHATMLTKVSSASERDNFIMQLHLTYGNSYVQRLMESVDIQAKLTISSPGDVYEKEADTRKIKNAFIAKLDPIPKSIVKVPSTLKVE